MKTLVVSNKIRVEEFEIDEHLQTHNRFFKLTNLPIMILHDFAKPLAALWRAVYSLAYGEVTEQEAFNAMKKAAAAIKAIEDATAAKYAA